MTRIATGGAAADDPVFGVLRLPDHVHLGAGSRASLPGLLAGYGRRVVVCCDPFLAATAHFDELVAGLRAAGLEVVVLTDVVPELPVDAVERAVRAAREARPDVVVGYGGGSALDLGKLVALRLVHDRPLAEFYGENAVPGPVLPFAAVPTTAGTGSEVTPVAVVSDPDRELKVGVSSPHLVPRVAIVDPELGVGAPPAVTAHSGIDALVHAIESYTAGGRAPVWRDPLAVFVGRNRMSSLLALEAVRVIGGNLRTAVHRGSDLAAREGMAYGALLAGMAFGSAGTHLSHALQYPIGALTHAPHGLGTGLMLPYVMRACLPAAEAELADVAAALGVGRGDPAAAARAAIDEVAALLADIGIPRTLGELGITAEQLPRIAALALQVRRLAGNAMVEATPELFDRILAAALHGDLEGLPS